MNIKNTLLQHQTVFGFGGISTFRIIVVAVLFIVFCCGASVVLAEDVAFGFVGSAQNSNDEFSVLIESYKTGIKYTTTLNLQDYRVLLWKHEGNIQNKSFKVRTSLKDFEADFMAASSCTREYVWGLYYPYIRIKLYKALAKTEQPDFESIQEWMVNHALGMFLKKETSIDLLEELKKGVFNESNGKTTVEISPPLRNFHNYPPEHLYLTLKLSGEKNAWVILKPDLTKPLTYIYCN